MFGKEIGASGPPSGEIVAVGREKVSAVKVENGGDERNGDSSRVRGGEKRRAKPNPRLSNPPKHLQGEQVVAGWPSWLVNVAGEAINGWTPRRADTFQKLDKASSFFFFLFIILGIACFTFCFNSVIVQWGKIY